MKEISAVKLFGGMQAVYAHESSSTNTEMKFAVFLPPQAEQGGKLPVLYWLSGLTCTEENFITKAGAQRAAAELGIILVAPDTSPRGEGVADDPDGAYDLGLGAGFYLNATREPWAAHYRMYDYVARELPKLVESEFPADPGRSGIFGHSMGGHGALTIHLKNPEKFKTCSAFAPIIAPMSAPWGRKAFSNYLGDDETAWRAYDSTALLEDRGASEAHILVDQGGGDQFLEDQLRPHLLEAAAKQANQPLTLRLQPGYDHSYYFIASFIEDHLRWHAKEFGLIS